MRALLIIILILPGSFLNSQITYDRMVLPFESIKGKTVFKIDDLMFEITCSQDYDFIYLNEKSISDKEYRIIDTTYFSPYRSNLYAYRSIQYSDYIILWVTEYEYDSDIHVFYYSDKQLNRVGILPVQNRCVSCDDQIYLTDDIECTGNDDNAEIVFLKPVSIKNENSEWQEYQPGEFKFILDKKSRKIGQHNSQ